MLPTRLATEAADQRTEQPGPRGMVSDHCPHHLLTRMTPLATGAEEVTEQRPWELEWERETDPTPSGFDPSGDPTPSDPTRSGPPLSDPTPR